METKWYTVTVMCEESSPLGYTLEARDELAAVNTVLGWLRVARQQGAFKRPLLTIVVNLSHKPPSLRADGTQDYDAPNPMPVAQ